MLVVARAPSKWSKQPATHSNSCSTGTPYNKSLPMSVKRAAVGKGGRRFKSCQSAQGKIPGIFLPTTVEYCPNDLPCPMAAMISTGWPINRRTVSTTVENDTVRLLAPNRMTRWVGDRKSEVNGRDQAVVNERSTAGGSHERLVAALRMLLVRADRLVTGIRQVAE